MPSILFSTGNPQKYSKAVSICSEYAINVIRGTQDIDEVQSEDTEYVARRKAEAAFAHYKQPVVISDDAWEIPGLNGFPGTYAKSINEWLTADDLIRLTHRLQDRRIFFIQTLVYYDGDAQQVFSRKTEGVLLPEPRGKVGVAIQKTVSLEPDRTTSVAEMMEGKTHYTRENTLRVWHDFAKWYTQKD